MQHSAAIPRAGITPAFPPNATSLPGKLPSCPPFSRELSSESLLWCGTLLPAQDAVVHEAGEAVRLEVAV